MKQKVIVKRTGKKGRGVFACKDFKVGEVIEHCPAIYITPKERKHLEKTILAYYMYPWRSMKSGCIVMGYGSLYNHSYNANADWKQNFRSTSMMYRAVKPIKKGEEITVNYNDSPDDQTPIDWFEVKK